MVFEIPAVRDRKRHGRHYTPRALARFLARRLLVHVPRPEPAGALRVLDPACGDGELLLALHAEAGVRWPGVRLELTGFDLDPAAMAAARSRAGAAGVEVDWRTGDFLIAAARLADGSFDAIITNPPYVRTQQLGGATAQLLSRQFGLRGRIDLTHPFVATVPRLLRPGGAIGLLCANRFLTTKAGANIRALLLSELAPVELYDLGDTKLFAAAVLPAITIATRGPRTGPCRYASAYQFDDSETCTTTDLFDALVAEEGARVRYNGRAYAIEIGTLVTGAPSISGRSPSADRTGPAGQRSGWATEPAGSVERGSELASECAGPANGEFEPMGEQCDSAAGRDEPPGKLDEWGGGVPGGSVTQGAEFWDGRGGSVAGRMFEGVWRMSRPGVDSWLARIGAGAWKSFGEVARIRVGIKTTADKVFISDRWGQYQPCPESELLRELITHQDLEPWRVARTRDTRVLYPYDLTRSVRTPIDLGEFPCAADYLRAHKDTLAARRYLTGSGREWYEIWVPQRPHLWRVPKVVFPDISDRPRFALDRSGAVVNGDCYWISFTDLAAAGDADRLAYLLMGVANSALGLRFYDAVCGNRLYSGRRRWITQYVSRLPLPDPASPGAIEIADLVCDLVDGGIALDATVQGALDERVAAAFGVR